MYCFEKGMGLYKKCINSNSYDFRKKIRINICRSRHVKQNGRNVFMLTFALVTGRFPKIFILTFAPILDTQCQISMGYKHVFKLIPTVLYIY